MYYFQSITYFKAVLYDNRSLPVLKKGDNSKSIRARLIKFTVLKRLIESNSKVPNAMECGENKILLTSLPVFDDVTFSTFSRPLRVNIYFFLFENEYFGSSRHCYGHLRYRKMAISRND